MQVIPETMWSERKSFNIILVEVGYDISYNLYILEEWDQDSWIPQFWLLHMSIPYTLPNFLHLQNGHSEIQILTFYEN